MTSIQDRLADPSFLSPQQRAAVEDPGNFFLNARPGSGKTRTAAIRLAFMATRAGKGSIAATSYTNVAIAQIRQTVSETGVLLDHRHFTGTLHEFLITFVLAPFAGLLGIKVPFRLVPSEWNGWNDVLISGDIRKRLPLSAFHYCADGTFEVKDAGACRRIGLTLDVATSLGSAQATALKLRARASGLISLSDAPYYAMRLLESSPKLCEAVASRFTEFIVDEAQDTSATQIRCLQLLQGSGHLRSLVLVGDPDQSIYAFQGASPSLFAGLVTTCGLRELQLTENYRSSQAICDVTCRFADRSDADSAVGANRNCLLAPELLLFPSKTPESVPGRFRDRLKIHGLDFSRAVVLARTSSLTHRLNGTREVNASQIVMALGTLASCVQSRRRVDRDLLASVERFLVEVAWGTAIQPQAIDQRLRIRLAAVGLAESLPLLTGPLDAWISKARAMVQLATKSLCTSPAVAISNRVRSKKGFDRVAASALFHLDPSRACTVHSVKGESYESVLLVASTHKTGSLLQGELWSALLNCEPVADNLKEELRIAYVALTRAERYCAIALPDDTDAKIISSFTRAGFVLAQ